MATPKYAPEFFDELEKSSPEDITSFMGQLNEDEQNEVVSAAEQWKLGKKPNGGMSFANNEVNNRLVAGAAGKGYEDPTQQMSLAGPGQSGGMNEPFYSHVKSPSGRSWYRIGHKQLSVEKTPTAFDGLKMALFPAASPFIAPAQFEALDAAKSLVLDPVVEAAQKQLRRTPFASVKTMTGVDSPGADYLYRAGTQWVFGKDNFEKMTPEEHLQSINDIDAVVRHPLYAAAKSVANPVAGALQAAEGLTGKQAMSTNDETAFATGLAQYSGEAPLMLISGGRGLMLAAAESPILGGALMGGLLGGVDSALRPGTQASEGVLGGAVGGAAFGGVIRGFMASKAVVEAANDLWSMTEGLKNLSPVKPMSMPSSFFEHMAAADEASKAARATENAIMGGVASSTPQEAFKHVPFSPAQKFHPSTALVGPGEVRFFEFKAGQQPRVMTVPLNSETNAKWVDSFLDKHLVDPIPTDGALESSNRFVRDFMTGGKEMTVKGKDGAVYGNRIGMSDKTPGRVSDIAPGVVEETEDGFIDIYRLTSQKARARAIASLRPVEATTLEGGTKVRGFLIQSADGAAVHPGHDLDGIPGFVDQIVPISVNKAVRPLSSKEIQEAAVLNPVKRQEALELAAQFDPRYSMEGGYARMVDDAREHLIKYIEKNPQYEKTLLAAAKETRVDTGLSKTERAKVRRFIAAEQRINNYGDVSSVPLDAAAAYEKYVKKLPALESRQSNMSTVRTLLKQEFKLSDSLTDVLSRDVMNATTPPVKGSKDYEYRMRLVREWFKPPELPAVLPPAQRPQFTMPQGMLPDDAARVSSMQLNGALGEASTTGADVFVQTMDGTVGKVLAHDGSKVTFETPNGVKVLSAGELQLAEPPSAAAPPFYTPERLTEALADAMRNSPQDRQLFNAIVKQAREDGMDQPGILRAVQDAAEIAQNKSQAIGTPPPPPPVDPPKPPPPGGGPPPNGRGWVSPGELEATKLGLRTPSFFEQVVTTIWGPRAAAPQDLGKAINLVYGTKNLEETVRRTVDGLQKRFGQKLMSDFDKALLRTFRGDGTVDDLKRTFPSIMNNREIEDTVSVAIKEKAVNALKLNELGMLDDVHVETEDLRNYITRLYARRFLPAGEWARMVEQNKPLMAEGRAVFTRMKEKHGLQGEALKDAAESALLEWVGALDVAKAKQMESVLKGNTGKAQSALKKSSLDELEQEILNNMGEDGLSLNGLKPGDVETLRKLLGANESGMLALASTLSKQKALIARGMLWRQVTSQMPEFFSMTPQPRWMQLPMNRSLYGDAAGRYVHPEAYEALVAVPQYAATNNKMAMAFSSFIKGNQISLGGMSTFNTNFFGSMKGAVVSGGLDVFSGVRLPHMKTAADMLYKARKNPLGPEAGLLDDIIRVGVDAPSFNSTEVGSVQGSYQEAVLRDLGDAPPMTATQLGLKSLKALTKPAQYAGVYYDTMDRLWKIGSYLSLLEKGGLGPKVIDVKRAYQFLRMNPEVRAYNVRLPKAQRGLLPPDFLMNESALIEAIKQEAALRVTSSFPMPDRVSPMMQKARGNVGFVAPYLTYKSEEMRVNLAILQRIKRGEYGLMFRMMGVAAASAGVAHLSRELGRMNGITDEDVEAANNMDSPSNKKFRPGRLALPTRDALGRVQYMDFTQYNDWMGTVAMLAGNDPVVDKMKNVVGNVLTFPFSGSVTEDYGQELAWKAGLAEQPFSAKLREDQKGITAVLDGMSRTGLLPKGAAWGYDIWRDSQQPEAGRFEPATPGQVAARAFGFRVWGVGDASAKARNLESVGSVLGAARDMKSVARTPVGTVQREVGSGTLDKAAAMDENRAALQEKQRIREEFMKKKSAADQRMKGNKP